MNNEIKEFISQFSIEQFKNETSPYIAIFENLTKGQPQLTIRQITEGIRDILKEEYKWNGFLKMWKDFLNSMKTLNANTTTHTILFDDIGVELSSGEYEVDEGGVTYIDFFQHEIVVCPHAVVPIERQINVDTHMEKMKLAFLRGDTWRYASFDKSTLASSNKIISIADVGIAVHSENAKEMCKYLTSIEEWNYKTIKEQKSVSRLGWINEHFFSPYEKEIIFDGDNTHNSIFEAIKPQGSRSKWIETMRPLREMSTPVPRLLMAASIASALVSPCQRVPFFVHLWGHASGTGKTVLLKIAASIWADPNSSFMPSLSGSANGLEAYCAVLNSLPLCVDELQSMRSDDRENAESFIHRLGDGRGKARATITGGARPIARWANCILTTGNVPLVTDDMLEGAVNRVMEIQWEDGNILSPQIASEICDSIAKNYGHIGKEIVEHIKEIGWSEISKIEKNIYKTLEGKKSTGKQYMAASLIMTADKLLDELIFKDGLRIKEHEVLQYLREKDDVDIMQKVLDWLFSLEVQYPNRFTPTKYIGEYSQDRQYVDEAWGVSKEKQLIIIKKVFDEQIKKTSYNGKAFLTWANRQGYLDTEDGRLTKLIRLHDNQNGNNSPVRCVCVARKIEELPI